MSIAIFAIRHVPLRAMPRVFASPARPATPRAARQADEGYGVTAEPSWREVDWSAHLHQVDIHGSQVNYVDIGSGPREPVVFVHGLGGQWQNWLENIPRAAQERRVIALDLPGFGLSEMPQHEISISNYARSVEALCQHLGLEKIALVGNSMGGFVSSEVAIRYPARVDRLVLVSAAGISSANVYRAPVLLVGRVAAVMTAYSAARHRQMARRPVGRHMALSLVARHPSRLAADLAWEGLIKGAGKPGFQDALRANLVYDFRDRLPEIACPTLIIWGENDAVISVQDAGEFERLIPDSRKLVMKDTGHVPMAERPAAFNDVLMEFVAETGRAEEKEAVEGETQAA
jgi:pimeloyl-ACP methyl ester carboxylesterase